ncbi:MAG: fluoride efflux transporter CrcB [Planctomycetales bacterium]|nr:fluoride efflux transporter CrcB [Planctomycetales bacterium]
MTQWLAIAAGGAVGAVSRYAISMGAARWLGATFPWGTLIVNLTGCLLLGMLAEWSQQQQTLSADIQKLLSVGFLGALTTFSTFAHETFRLAENDRLGLAMANAGLNLGLGLLAVWAGISWMRK